MQIKSTSKMAENMQDCDKKSSYFLGRHCLSTLIGLGPSFVNLISFSEIHVYTEKVFAHDLQVQIKIAIENSL